MRKSEHLFKCKLESYISLPYACNYIYHVVTYLIVRHAIKPLQAHEEHSTCFIVLSPICQQSLTNVPSVSDKHRI